MLGPTSSFVRMPAVAGRFYTDDPVALRKEVAAYLGLSRRRRPCLALMAPHAGYVYSGRIAGMTFGRAVIPRRVVILAPNHTGLGARISLLASGTFRIPGADVPVDEELAGRILNAEPSAQHDPRAHQYEHAVEVEVPFLRESRPDLSIVPVVVGGLEKHEVLSFGESLYEAAKDLEPSEVLVVASSDMSHYLPDDVARKRDRIALDPLLALDAGGLYDAVVQNDISMCGYLPATAMLAYARKRGATRAELVEYGTSADAFGDTERVVGYAGVVVS